MHLALLCLLIEDACRHTFVVDRDANAAEESINELKDDMGFVA